MGEGEQIRGRQLKGVAIDCAQILIEVYSAAGVIEWFSTGRYPADWMMHRDEERYLGFILPLADEIEPDAALPADIAVWRYGRTFSHGGIVSGRPGVTPPTGWPWVVHAFSPYHAVSEDDATVPSPMTTLNDGRPRPMRAFRLKSLG